MKNLSAAVIWLNNVVGMDGRSLKWAYDSHNLSLHYYWGIRMGEARGGRSHLLISSSRGRQEFFKLLPKFT